MVLEAKNRWKEINNLIIYHQNIRSLKKKKDEISIMLQEIQGRPHLICLSEHHMRKEEMLDFSFPGYKLANSFCRETNLKGGVCILARNDMIYQPIYLNKLCKEKIFEISAVKLNIGSIKVILCCVYRSPSKNPNYFVKQLEKTLNLLYQPNISFVICGDLNINFLIESTVKQNLVTLMKTFNLTQVVTFPTRICNDKRTLIDSIFLDNAKYNNISVYPFENGLSDHVAQILTLRNIKVPLQKYTYTRKTRLMDDKSIANFQSYLREEAWIQFIILMMLIECSIIFIASS
jgi:exonuclease III